MNKKILIASVFATLMLLVPVTSVVGISDVEDDCGCQVVSSSNLVRVKLLLVRLKVITNILLLRFGYILEIQEKSYEILDVINSDGFWDDFCNSIVNIMETIQDLIENYDGIYKLLTPAFTVLLSLWFWFCWLR